MKRILITAAVGASGKLATALRRLIPDRLAGEPAEWA